MNFLPLIESKREGNTLMSAQIQEFIREFTAGKIPDYQMAAMLMAIFFRGLNTAETTALTLAMRDSGDKLNFPKDQRPVVDKHVAQRAELATRFRCHWRHCWPASVSACQ